MTGRTTTVGGATLCLFFRAVGQFCYGGIFAVEKMTHSHLLVGGKRERRWLYCDLLSRFHVVTFWCQTVVSLLGKFSQHFGLKNKGCWHLIYTLLGKTVTPPKVESIFLFISISEALLPLVRVFTAWHISVLANIQINLIFLKQSFPNLSVIYFLKITITTLTVI